MLSPWSAWRPATCWPEHCFCEAIRQGWIRQPANTVSSLAFVIVAVMVWFQGRSDERSSGPRTAMHGLAGYPLVFSIALTLTGLGSAFYHASLSFAGQFVDVMGMYLIATFIILYALGRLRHLTNSRVVLIYLAANSSLAYLLFAFPAARRYAFAVLLIVGIVIERLARRTISAPLDVRLLFGAMATLAVAFAIWALDITRVVCAPHSMVQGHAVWHVLGAVASWQLYRYYRYFHYPVEVAGF